jgi:hypothetical protein
MKKFTFIVGISCFFLNLHAQITVSSNNYVGIGISSPLATLHVNGNSYLPSGGSYWINSTSDNGVRLRLHNNGSASYIDFYPSINFRTSYSASGLSNTPLYLTYGCVGINNGSPTCALDVTGVIHMNGSTVTSDERLKDNVKNMTGSLSSLSRLRGVSYTLKPFNSLKSSVSRLTAKSITKADSVDYSPSRLQGLDSAYISRNHVGFLAQDVQKVYPELVYTDKEGILSVDYISLIPVLVESIKEQQSVIDILKAQVAELMKKTNSK